MEAKPGLVALAAARGLALPQFVENLLREQAIPTQAGAALTPAERAAAWLEGSKRFPHTPPPLSDEAISRESMYEDRG